MLEVVRDRVEAVQTSQHAIVQELRDIRANLPMQRKPLSARTESLHVRVTLTRRNGICPCCQETPVCTDSGRLPGAEYDHWYSRSQNRATQTWLVCGSCNQRLRDTEFKASTQAAFESYQQALKPFLSARQMNLGLA